MSALRDEKKDDLSGLGEAVSTIKDHVAESLHPLLLGKIAPRYGQFYKIDLKYLANENIHRVRRRLYEEIVHAVSYTSSYQANLIKEGSSINMDTVELLLRANMVRNLGPEYSGLVSSIQSECKEETTNLSDTSLRIVRYDEIPRIEPKSPAHRSPTRS